MPLCCRPEPAGNGEFDLMSHRVGVLRLSLRSPIWDIPKGLAYLKFVHGKRSVINKLLRFRAWNHVEGAVHKPHILTIKITTFIFDRSEEHSSELQSRQYLVC